MALHLKKEEERVFIRECIRLYRNLPALWDTTSEIYKNKFEKSRCYDILLAKYRERYHDATKEDLKKKINSLRTNYRKELKKQEDSKLRNGYNYYGEKYAPSLFYFEDINFLHALEAPSLVDVSLFNVTKKERVDDLDPITASLSFDVKEETPIAFPAENPFLQQAVVSNSNSAITTNNTSSLSSIKNQTQNQNIMDGVSTNYMRFCTPLLPNTPSINHHNHHPHHQFSENKSSINHHQQHHLQNSSVLSSLPASPSAAKRPRKHNSCIINQNDDEFYHLAKVWANEVSKMSPDQQLFAKKAINDIIFEGQLGGLHRSSVKINIDIENNGLNLNNNDMVVGVQTPEVAMFVPADDANEDDDVSSGSMSPPPISFQTQTQT